MNKRQRKKRDKKRWERILGQKFSKPVKVGNRKVYLPGKGIELEFKAEALNKAKWEVKFE